MPPDLRPITPTPHQERALLRRLAEYEHRRAVTALSIRHVRRSAEYEDLAQRALTLLAAGEW